MKMKAGVVTSKGNLEVIEVPVPEIGPYDALCMMTYGATCAGTDIHLTDGLHPFPVYFPTILGHESVGRVIKTGSKVRNYHEGDLITRVGCPELTEASLHSNWGGFAEYGIARDHIAMKEDGIPREKWDRNRVNQVVNPLIEEKTAPMIITWRETLSYIRRLGVSAGDRVLVTGSGANALSLAVHCCNSGASVVAVGSESRRSLYSRTKVTEYINYRSEKLHSLMSDASPSGYDYIIDGVGTSSIVTDAIDLLKHDGIVGVYGWNDRSNYALNPFKAKASFRVYADGYDEEESNEEVQSLIVEGRLDPSLWYDMENPVPLEDLTEAYQRLRRHEAVKYLIELKKG